MKNQTKKTVHLGLSVLNTMLAKKALCAFVTHIYNACVNNGHRLVLSNISKTFFLTETSSLSNTQANFGLIIYIGYKLDQPIVENPGRNLITVGWRIWIRTNKPQQLSKPQCCYVTHITVAKIYAWLNTINKIIKQHHCRYQQAVIMNSTRSRCVAW